MASTRQLKSRIRSVKNTKQITKAMQMVAASKMRRAQDATKASAPYTKSASELLASLAAQVSTDDHPLFEKREVKKRLIILIAADKGLAGAYNSGVLKRFLESIKRGKAKSQTEFYALTIGRKAGQLISRLKDVESVGHYDDMPDYPGGMELLAIQTKARNMFESGDVDAVDIVYTDFVSSITQVPSWRRILPAGFSEAEVSETTRDAKYEPNASEVLDGVAFRLVGAQIFQALLDARASEHSMRMVAMKNATDNASDLIDDLTLAMNKARQGAITQELSEISAGVEAMK